MMVEISHELQTPLSIMKLELEMLRGDLSSNPALPKLEHSIDEISKFVYSFMHLAHLESDKEDLAMEPVNFSELIEELMDYFSVLIVERGIELTGDIKKDVCVLGDRSKLEEVVTNLISNSIKYMCKKEDRERKIYLTLGTNKNKAVVKIKDTGIGINRGDLPYIFDRFYRTNCDKSDIEKGLGLGLAITKKIVETHSGKIEAKSRINKGSSFTIELPLADDTL